MTTLKQAMQSVREFGFVLRKVEGEYQTKPRAAGWNDAVVYFTSDIDDAVSTARAIQKQIEARETAKRDGKAEIERFVIEVKYKSGDRRYLAKGGALTSDFYLGKRYTLKSEATAHAKMLDAEVLTVIEYIDAFGNVVRDRKTEAEDGGDDEIASVGLGDIGPEPSDDDDEDLDEDDDEDLEAFDQQLAREEAEERANRQPTNVEMLTHLMNFSRCGALQQAFILTAIEKYAKECIEAGAKKLDTPMISGEGWIRCADEALETLNKHFGR